MTRTATTRLLLALLLGASIRVTAQERIVDPQGAARDELGVAIAQSGDWLALGSPGVQADRGALRLYLCDGESCTHEQTLAPAELQAGDGFGRVVAIDGNQLAVASPGRNDGAVFLFERVGGSWSLRQRLDAPAAGEGFGAALAIAGSRLYVGAPGADNNAGAVEVYLDGGTSWNSEARLLASLSEAGASYGHALAVNGARLAVGAPGASDGLPGSHAQGTVELRSALPPFALQTTLNAPGQPQGARFGSAVALGADRALIGAPKAAAGAGRAWAFGFDGLGWLQEAEFGAVDALAGDRYGWSVALAADRALVGAPFALAGCGQILQSRHDGNGWGAPSVLNVSPVLGQLAGYAVSASGGRAAIGVPGYAGPASHRGAAFAIDLADRIHADDFDTLAQVICLAAD